MIIFLALTSRRALDGDLVADLTPFHWVSLGACGLILFGWWKTKNATLSYCLMQVVALIAYLPTIARVLHADTQTESNILWGAILLSSLVAVPSAIRAYKERQDWLGFVYLGRTIPSNLIMVYLVEAKSFGWPMPTF